MAATVGQVIGAANTKRAVCLMAAQGSATTPPTLSTDGVPAYPTETIYASDTGAFFAVDPPYRSTLLIHNSAGNGSLTGIFTLYGYLAASGVWYPVKVNGGAAVTGTNTIRYQETYLYNLSQFDRLFLDVQSPGGTGQQFEAWLATPQENY